jgi:tetratricopeptide (TPR) repeat protein
MSSSRGTSPVPIAIAIAISLSACATPEAEPDGTLASPSASAPKLEHEPERDLDRETDLRTSADAELRLRALFPEIQGEITRESIANALAAERGRPNRDATALAPQDRPGRVRAALDSGDYETARELLGELLVEQELARASDLLAHDDPRRALAILDRAVEIAPKDAAVRCLRGEAGLRVGAEDGERALVEAALADYLVVAADQDSATGWLGASRSASWLGRVDDALEYARNGVRSLRRNPEQAVAGIPAERTLAEASFDVYRAARRAGGADTLPPSAESTRARQCFDECKSALEALIARYPKDAWAWQRLSALYESEGLDSEAESIALRGLNEAPSDEDLHQRLARISSTSGGRTSLLAVYADFKTRHPNVALAEWYPAVAHFESAVEALSAQSERSSRTAASGGQESSQAAAASGARDSTRGNTNGSARAASLDLARDSFRDAEKGFARCRALDPKYADACRSYELLCRDGQGWCAFRDGDLDAAQKAFLSMEDLRSGGLAAELDHKLASGIVGLHWVGGAYAARAQSENSLASLDNLERAGKIYDFLHEYQPDDVTWANDSGFFNRDTAVALERKAQSLFDQGKIEEANRLLDRARELMDKSFRAYVDAARLAPEDVRIQNDTGLILTYYLQRDLEQAQAYLNRARELGEKQVPELERELERSDLTPEQRDEQKKKLEFVESALGDAYQNLGVLALTLIGDPKSARAWFEKSTGTGQDAREEITRRGGYLDQCDAAIAGRSSPLVNDRTRWGAPRSTKPDKKTN